MAHNTKSSGFCIIIENWSWKNFTINQQCTEFIIQSRIIIDWLSIIDWWLSRYSNIWTVIIDASFATKSSIKFIKLFIEFIIFTGIISNININSIDNKITSSTTTTVSSLSTNSAKTFTCTECGKVFNAHYNLTRHMPVHTGARPFVCTWPDCDQRFNRKYNLNRHLWIHAENKNKNQQQQ